MIKCHEDAATCHEMNKLVLDPSENAAGGDLQGLVWRGSAHLWTCGFVDLSTSG